MMPVFKVWYDPLYEKYSNESVAIEVVEADAASAAKEFARQEYGYKQHCDPGVVLVRGPSGPVERYRIGYEIHFIQEKDPNYVHTEPKDVETADE